ncbi:negative regulator of sexual conjugation and meiosis [Cordyceps fumosorosea ARSEF 2679]|uniref:Negative regulator of sexual conjugation and meiosis n=1 Tax=Cordyceps fumosorosea (strain ARSEF 2679) TaxID=1081104 RepID=A0A162MDI9_CORFA|nr:negative regulator of sexual conjugation and meiosis [Cordyceps fumosorosea ARSEF 2679]OAA54640.1 negative regulator of sexual conjugation and meiosis [Cordyceps fumosorosea ARSEF 2679]
MQSHVPFGYPTPPASPTYDKCQFQQPPPVPQPQYHARHHQQFQPQPPVRCVPLAPEQRLGRLLEGKLQLTDILGTGAYGVVYAAVDVETGVRYAVKCLSKFAADGTPLERRQVAYQQREISLHYRASAHANVVSLHRIVHDVDCVYVVLEYCPEGDLFLHITERGHFVGDDPRAKRAFLQILDAVEHCHALGVYHRDLKPENILVTDGGETVKLADFGLATAEDRSEDYGCGSTFYMSPECLEPTTATTTSPFYMCAPNDVWSLGVILVNLTCGRNPWKQASAQDSTYRAYVRSPGFLKTILPLSDDLDDILGRVFHPDPAARITMPELRRRILACPSFTVSPERPARPVLAVTEEIPEDVIVDDYDCDDYEDEEALSPASDFSEEEGSLASSVSTVDDLDEEDDFMREEMAAELLPTGTTYDAEEAMMVAQACFQQQQYNGPVPVPAAPVQQVPVPILPSQQALMHQQMLLQQQQHHAPPPPPTIPSQPPCQQHKSFFPLWEVVKLVQQAPVMQHPSPFHQQVSFLPSFQGY